jgi:pilus assembly protein CpaF
MKERADLIDDEPLPPSPLDPFLRDPEVTEILVNGPFSLWAERNGAIERLPAKFEGEEPLWRWVRKCLSRQGRKADHASPFADGILPDGSRIHVVVPPATRAGICLSIRKFPAEAWTLASLERTGMLSPASRGFLLDALKRKKNIFLSGGTGCGKTSLLGALLAEVPPTERVVALEDVAEIKTSHPHFLSLEARPPNQEGEGEIRMHRLLREALRMRPDRIVVGECRGPEALDLLLALNTGHGGSMGTIHANSPREALQRLETLALLAAENLRESALKSLILGGVQIVVQLERKEGRRKLTRIAELKGVDSGCFLLKETIF